MSVPASNSRSSICASTCCVCPVMSAFGSSATWPGEIGRARRAVDDELGQALADVAAFDRHGAILIPALRMGVRSIVARDDAPPRPHARRGAPVRRRRARRVRRARAQGSPRPGRARRSGRPRSSTTSGTGSGCSRRASCSLHRPDSAALGIAAAAVRRRDRAVLGQPLRARADRRAGLGRRHAVRRPRVSRRVGRARVGGVAVVTYSRTKRATAKARRQPGLSRPSRRTPSPPSPTSRSRPRCASRSPRACRRPRSRPASRASPSLPASRATSPPRR